MESVNPIDVGIGPKGLLFIFGEQQSRLVRLGATQDAPVVFDVRRAHRTAKMVVPSRCGYCCVAGPAARVAHSDLNSPVIRPRGAGI